MSVETNLAILLIVILTFGFGFVLRGSARIPARTLMLSVVSDLPTGHGERDQCYRDHCGYRREHQVGHVNSGQSFEHAAEYRFELFCHAHLA
jgi:hypothetical protein